MVLRLIEFVVVGLLFSLGLDSFRLCFVGYGYDLGKVGFTHSYLYNLQPLFIIYWGNAAIDKFVDLFMEKQRFIDLLSVSDSKRVFGLVE